MLHEIRRLILTAHIGFLQITFVTFEPSPLLNKITPLLGWLRRFRTDVEILSSSYNAMYFLSFQHIHLFLFDRHRFWVLRPYYTLRHSTHRLVFTFRWLKTVANSP